jgi:hypothetical protein
MRRVVFHAPLGHLYYLCGRRGCRQSQVVLKYPIIRLDRCSLSTAVRYLGQLTNYPQLLFPVRKQNSTVGCCTGNISTKIITWQVADSLRFATSTRHYGQYSRSPTTLRNIAKLSISMYDIILFDITFTTVKSRSTIFPQLINLWISSHENTKHQRFSRVISLRNSYEPFKNAD